MEIDRLKYEELAREHRPHVMSLLRKVRDVAGLQDDIRQRVIVCLKNKWMLSLLAVAHTTGPSDELDGKVLLELDLARLRRELQSLCGISNDGTTSALEQIALKAGALLDNSASLDSE